jgi:hypothetical protein
MTKQQVTIWAVRDMSWNENCPTKLAAFAEWANGLLAKVPAEFLDQARVEVESDYDSSSVTFEVSYKRLETDEEEALREARQNAMQQAQRERELAELRRLQSKYGKP